MSADMNLQTRRGNRHGRGTYLYARRSANISFVRSEYRGHLSAILTFPHEIVKQDKIRQEAQNKYYKVQIVFHADWSDDEWANDNGKRKYIDILQSNIHETWLEYRHQVAAQGIGQIYGALARFHNIQRISYRRNNVWCERVSQPTHPYARSARIYHVRAELTMQSIQKTSVLKRVRRTRSSIIYLRNQANTATLRNAFIRENPTYRLQSILRLRRTFPRATKYCTEEREHEKNKQG